MSVTVRTTPCGGQCPKARCGLVVVVVPSYAGRDVAADAESRRQAHGACRVGLVGNLSDGFGGAVLGAIEPGLAATVTAVPTPHGVRIEGPDAVERWAAVQDLTHDGPQRIVTAAVARLGRHVDAGGVSITWHSEIPRSVGRAGSSALAVGTIDATAAWGGIQLDRRVVAALALSAERDLLDIAAGWQDRIIQSAVRVARVLRLVARRGPPAMRT